MQHLGEWRRASECFAEVLRLLPPSAEAYTNLGTSLKGQGKLPEAAAAYREAFTLEPDRPEVAYNLATTLHELDNLDEAVDYYRLALRLKPSYPEASNNLATALKEQGRLDEAVTQFRATLVMHSDHVLPYYNLSELAAAGHYRFSPEELARVKNLLRSAQVPALDRSFCAFTLASVHAKQGAHDEAFSYYREANQLRKNLLEAQGLAFDAERHDALVDRIIAGQDRGYFRQVAGWGTATDLPVFIIGMPRSGSTLVEQILASHPRVFGAGELGEVPELHFRFGSGSARRASTPALCSPVRASPKRWRPTTSSAWPSWAKAPTG